MVMGMDRYEARPRPAVCPAKVGRARAGGAAPRPAPPNGPPMGVAPPPIVAAQARASSDGPAAVPVPLFQAAITLPRYSAASAGVAE